jgi:hypothetical protein
MSTSTIRCSAPVSRLTWKRETRTLVLCIRVRACRKRAIITWCQYARSKGGDELWP